MENNTKSKGSVLFSYLDHPDIKFETYEQGEKVVLLLRSHPFTQIGWILYSIFLFLFLLIMNPFISGFLKPPQLFMVNIMSLVFIAAYVWFSFLNWYFNVGIVTNKRIIDIDFSGILYKEVTVARQDKIEDITIKSGGYFEAFFDYGVIFIQTAGMETNIEFHDVPRPSEAVKIINNLLGKRHGG